MGASRAEAALYVLFLLILFVRDAFHPSALQFLLHPFVASLHLLPQRISLFLRQEKRQRHVLLLPLPRFHNHCSWPGTKPHHSTTRLMTVQHPSPQAPTGKKQQVPALPVPSREAAREPSPSAARTPAPVEDTEVADLAFWSAKRCGRPLTVTA